MIVGVMSVNLATSARTSAIPGLESAVFKASAEANSKCAIITYGAGVVHTEAPTDLHPDVERSAR